MNSHAIEALATMRIEALQHAAEQARQARLATRRQDDAPTGRGLPARPWLLARLRRTRPTPVVKGYDAA